MAFQSNVVLTLQLWVNDLMARGNWHFNQNDIGQKAMGNYLTKIGLNTMTD